ncbi:hypothetical protein V1504DRAFT_439304 [Lipomyces starkeyi]
MANQSEFEQTEVQITRQQVYNFWLSLTQSEWQRDPADDFRSAQLLLAEQEGYELIQGLQEPGISLASSSSTPHLVQISTALSSTVFSPGYDLVSLPLSYLLLGKRGSRLTEWFTALRNAGLMFTLTRTLRVTAASIAFGGNNSTYNHHRCLWHSLRAIDQHIAGKVKGRGADSIDAASNSTRKAALPPYLHFLSLRAMIKRHLLRHPLLPKEDIHACSIKEMLEYCRSIDQPQLFRYFWATGSRWEIASLCVRPGSNTIPISRTTMRLESHWRILKKDYASHLTRLRLDLLTHIICTGLVRSRLHLYLQVYEDLVHIWRKCAELIDDDFLNERDELYHTDKINGHYIVPPPPTFTPGLFQEFLPLIRMSNYVDDDTMATSSNYAEELASLQLLPSENPEATEENGEQSMELLRIMHGMQRDVCNFIRNPESFIARFKRPYEEAMGSARSASSQTMRKAARSYFYMRPQNQSQRSV